jgi:hypothetical protein
MKLKDFIENESFSFHFKNKIVYCDAFSFVIEEFFVMYSAENFYQVITLLGKNQGGDLIVKFKINTYDDSVDYNNKKYDLDDFYILQFRDKLNLL